jgi:ribonuclease D
MTSPGNGGPPRRTPRQPWNKHRELSHAQAHLDPSLGQGTEYSDHILACRDMPALITRPDQLAELVENLREAGSFAYDSEFIGELTYLPKLCLIQAASATRIALIDPLTDLDISPFWELVADPSVEKIVHAGQQDIEPLFRALGKPPANLFDTQIAAGFIAIGYPLALSKLVYALVGAKLGKGLTFTHWDRRPLSDHQLRYAADDVRYLPAVRHEIGKRLDSLGHAQWAREESAALADPALYAFDPKTSWTRIRGSSSMQPKNQIILRELTIWRDAAARDDDTPPRALVRDEVLIDLAKSPPAAPESLGKVRGLPRPVQAKYGPQIIEAVQRAQAMSLHDWPVTRNYEPGPDEKFRADALFYAAQCLSAGQQIDPNLIASRQEIGELFRALSTGNGEPDLRILRGWRRHALGEKLLDLFHGKLTISAHWRDGRLRVD